MKIDVELLKKQSLQVKQIIDSYELNYLNFFNALNQAMDCWQDEHSKLYLEQINYQKNESNKVILDLKELNEIFKSIVFKYDPIAKQIYYLKDNKNSLFNIFEKYLNQIVDSINIINNMDLSFCPTEKEIILNIKTNLVNNQQSIKKIYYNVKNTVKDIERKEIEINSLLSKYENRIVKELEYRNYI